MGEKEDKARASLARIYAANYEKILARVAVVEEALTSLRSTADVPAELRRKAEAEAHKLAGVLGTFGLAEGTRLSREIELMLRGIEPLPGDAVQRLTDLTTSLRVELKPPA